MWAEVERLAPWHHDVEIAPGIRTGDRRVRGNPDPALGAPSIVDPLRNMRMLIGDIYPEGLAGRSFLDCACNAGGHSFAASALGAGRVYGFDARPHWIAQANFLARHLPAENMSFETHPLAGLAVGETFDVTLFRGIFYHLPDPVAGLKIAADRTRELIIVNTASRPRDESGLLINLESETEVMSGVDRLAWLPTRPEVVTSILQTFGFAHSRVRFNWQTGPDWGRFEVLAAREASTFAHFDTIEPEIRKHGRSPGRSSRLQRLIRRLRR